MAPVEVQRQLSLFRDAAVGIDAGATPVRLHLDARCWVDHARCWVRGADELFARVLAGRKWQQHTRRMWEKEVLEPRLTSHWSAAEGTPLAPEEAAAMRAALCERYGVVFDSVGFNLYRDGRDSVAWHADRIRRELAEPIVALVSLGAPRRFLLRPRGGGKSIRFELGHGDLLVTGGRTQREWEHCVPKVARADPRISIALREGSMPRAYGRSPAPPALQGLAT